MKKKIAIVSYGRKQSQRCPNKILRPFVGTTLMDLVLSKIRTFGEDAFFAGLEDEIKKKCESYGVTFIQRDEESAFIDGPILRVYDFVRQLDYKKILFVNVCLPFLKIETIKRFLDHCENNYDQPALAVLKRANYFFNHDKSLLFDPVEEGWNTKIVKPKFESANALYFFDRNFFLEKGFFWDWEQVSLVPFNKSFEFLDIDTEDDFQQAEFIYRGRRRSE